MNYGRRPQQGPSQETHREAERPPRHFPAGRRGRAVGYLESDRVGDQFIVILLFHHFVSQEDLDWVAHFPEANFTDEDVRALVFLREAGAINNSAYRDVNKGVDTLTASIRLRRLRDLGLLSMKGKSTATYYVPTPKLLGPLQAPEPRSQADNLRGLSDNLRSLSDNLRGLPDNLPGLPDKLLTLVKDLGERATPEAIRSAICRLCAWQELSAARLVAILKRSKRYVQATYLNPLVEAKELAPKFPDRPNHPDQAYRAVKKRDWF